MFVFSNGGASPAWLSCYCPTVGTESLGQVARFPNVDLIAGWVTASENINSCIVICVLLPPDSCANSIFVGIYDVYPTLRVKLLKSTGVLMVRDYQGERLPGAGWFGLCLLIHH